MILSPIDSPPPPPPPPRLSSLSLTNQRGGAWGEKRWPEQTPVKRLTNMKNSTTTTMNTTTVGDYVDYCVLPAPSSLGSRRNLSADEGGGGRWEHRGERGKERSRRGKTADSSSEGDDKELLDAKPKADDGGDRPFAMRRRRCGRRPPARCQVRGHPRHPCRPS